MKTQEYFHQIRKILDTRHRTANKIALGAILIPFVFCVIFLKRLGTLLHLTYQQISVIFNLYLQGGLLALSGFCPLLALCMSKNHSAILPFLLALFYAMLHAVGLFVLIRHYPLPMELAFDQCVADLQFLSRRYHVTYWTINLLIFVLGWLFLIGFNLGLSLYISNGF